MAGLRKKEDDHQSEDSGDEEELVPFEQMGLDAKLLQAIVSLGWKKPTLIQEKCIPLSLEGKVFFDALETLNFYD